jgi:glycosyltransferase involved in cell wall biosynthesis
MTTSGERAIEASVIITTFNRRDALLETLRALDRQDDATPSFEILVTDDGSTDGTFEALRELVVRAPLRTFRHEANSGISAGRNRAIVEARGRVLILLSDDLIVPSDFVRLHLKSLAEHPGCWIVGGFRQLPSLRDTAFGRYLDDIEEGFTRARKAKPLGDGLWELHWPTARNLSLPRTDFDHMGPFDVRFRVSCEDQDLAIRAKGLGLRFLYDEAIDSLHNDQAGDLKRCCRAQRRGAHDTALLCAKHPVLNRDAPFVRECGPLRLSDGPRLWFKKVAKLGLSRDWPLAVVEWAIAAGERAHLPERILRRSYQGLIGVHTFRGWREGLRTVRSARGALGHPL